jgi:hypothetical protein
MAIPAQFEDAAEFSEGRAAVKTGDQWGFIDKTGEMVIPPQFVVRFHPFFGYYRFSEGVAHVWVGKKWGYIDMAGKFVWGPTKTELCGDACWLKLPLDLSVAR